LILELGEAWRNVVIGFQSIGRQIRQHPIATTALISTALVGGAALAYTYYTNNSSEHEEKISVEDSLLRNIERLYFDISIDLQCTSSAKRIDTLETKLKQLLSTGEYLVNEKEFDLAIKYLSTATGLAVIISDFKKANNLKKMLIKLYGPKLTEKYRVELDAEMVLEMKAGQSLRDKEIERNNAEIEEISPSVLKQIENMPKRNN
jgi:hypothetical protein